MKKLYTLLTTILITAALWAQSPEKIGYQTVIRNRSNALVTNTQIGLEINLRQGTPTGTIVYTETQTPTTNANGLVSFEIGVDEGFGAIDWSAGPYYIETKTAVTPPLTTYTITRTSQLLSVPYALHAKTADSITGDNNSHHVGELYGGGVVFWVDHIGQHGLIVSMINFNRSNWSNIGAVLIGPSAQSDWDGAGNTIAIIGQSGHINSAAKVCDDYTNEDYGTGIYSDWYLPSFGELNELSNNFKAVQKSLTIDGNDATLEILKDWYWSSTEANSSGAIINSFVSGGPVGWDKASTIIWTRAVRAF